MTLLVSFAYAHPATFAHTHESSVAPAAVMAFWLVAGALFLGWMVRSAVRGARMDAPAGGYEAPPRG